MKLVFNSEGIHIVHTQCPVEGSGGWKHNASLERYLRLTVLQLSKKPFEIKGC